MCIGIFCTHDSLFLYRLPQDLYQTAKISKLLILIDKGSGDKYKGKSLNEIDINSHLEYAETDESDNENSESTAVYETVPSNTESKSQVESISTASTPIPTTINARTCKY